MSPETLLIFLKAPRPGSVKTRLAESIGPEAAAGVYCELVNTTLEQVSGLESVVLLFSPDDAGSEIQSWVRPGWGMEPQGNGELGTRLTRAVNAAFERGVKRLVSLGSDCPWQTAADVRAAWKELETSDVVLGPAEDGGYWLIGLRAPTVSLFRDISWSQPAVLRETLDRVREAGLSHQLLRTLPDIDTEADWLRWRMSGARG